MSNSKGNNKEAKKNARNNNDNSEKTMYMNGAILLEIMRRLDKPATALEITRAVADFFEVPAITIKPIVIEHIAVSTRMGFLIKTDPRHYVVPNIDLDDKKREINNNLALSNVKPPKNCDFDETAKCDNNGDVDKNGDDELFLTNIHVSSTQKYASIVHRACREMKHKYGKPLTKCTTRSNSKRQLSDLF